LSPLSRLEGGKDAGIHKSPAQRIADRISKRSAFGAGHGKIRFENGAYTIVGEYFESDLNTALRQKMSVLKSVLAVVLPGNAIHRTRLHRFLDTIFRAAFRHGNFCFFFFFVERKNFRTKLNTAFTADAFVSIYNHSSGHDLISF
jgi:hypothetical protein